MARKTTYRRTGGRKYTGSLRRKTGGRKAGSRRSGGSKQQTVRVVIEQVPAAGPAAQFSGGVMVQPTSPRKGRF